MTIPSLSSCAAVVTCVVGLASPAAAATMVATYEGVVTGSEYIGGNYFGLTPGGSLDGEAVSIRVRYDPALGERYTYPGDYVLDFVYGGDFAGTASPILSYLVTINGYSEEMASPYYGFAQVTAYGIGQSTNSNGATRYASVAALNSGGPYFTGGLETPIPTTALTAPWEALGAFGILSCNGPDCTPADDYIRAEMRLDTITVATATPVAPVPLPATFALSLAALGALVLAGRRRPA